MSYTRVVALHLLFCYSADISGTWRLLKFLLPFSSLYKSVYSHLWPWFQRGICFFQSNCSSCDIFLHFLHFTLSLCWDSVKTPLDHQIVKTAAMLSKFKVTSTASYLILMLSVNFCPVHCIDLLKCHHWKLCTVAAWWLISNLSEQSS